MQFSLVLLLIGQESAAVQCHLRNSKLLLPLIPLVVQDENVFFLSFVGFQNRKPMSKFCGNVASEFHWNIRLGAGMVLFFLLYPELQEEVRVPRKANWGLGPPRVLHFLSSLNPHWPESWAHTERLMVWVTLRNQPQPHVKPPHVW